MSHTTLVRLCCLATVLLFQGCASHTNLYHWGEYQELVYDIYLNPGEADPATQIYKLNLSIEQAENSGMKVAPGIFAHLGMVHAQVGNPMLAKDALLQEKALYPESSVFIDGILSRSNLPDEQLKAHNGHQMESVQ
jgi:hypothetical protein